LAHSQGEHYNGERDTTMIWRIIGVQFIFLLNHTVNLCATNTRINIIFVHLGDTIPVYAYTAFEQARLFNDNACLHLIANKRAIESSLYDFASKAIKTIACESLSPSSAHKKFRKNTRLDTRFRDKFWYKTSERFFYIDEYVSLHNLTYVVHLENDVMLYADLTQMYDAFARYEGIGAIFDCDSRCIPSLIYIADKKAIAHLVSFMAKHASKGYNDMRIIVEYRKSHSKQYIDNLPLIMPEYLINHRLINIDQQTACYPLEYCNNSEIFNSIFDGAALGQYLGGIDQKNGLSGPGFINETALFNPSYLTIEWRKDAYNRNVPFAHCNGVSYRINNLHIHSKRLDNFCS
jgi:hypothetical protein